MDNSGQQPVQVAPELVIAALQQTIGAQALQIAMLKAQVQTMRAAAQGEEADHE